MEDLKDIFDSMGKSGGRFIIGQVIGTQTNVYGKDSEPKETAKPEVVDHEEIQEHDEELFHYIHPAVDSQHEWQIHHEVKRLVARQGIQEICQYLQQMVLDKKILLPQSADSAYTELVRMGMPDGEGFQKKTFMKYYKK
jgi:hypothetical protein